MIEAIAPLETSTALVPRQSAVPPANDVSFSEMLMGGIQNTTTKLAEADTMVALFAVDDSIPLHQVTYALEEARISFELMLQVRNRLLDASQQLMNMQV